MHEKRYGFGSLLLLMCVECGISSNIKTSKYHHIKKKGTPLYNMNTKAAGAMMHWELSVTGMQKIMASLEVSQFMQEHWKREKEIGVTIEKVAKKPYLDAADLEQNLCIWKSYAVNKEGIVDLKANYDIGWQIKGSERTCNSRSEHVILLGTENEKVLSYGTRISNC